MSKKRLVIVGNKPSTNNKYIDFIDSSDLVCRINHMNNMPYSGHKTDIYMMEYNFPDRFQALHAEKCPNQSYDDFINYAMSIHTTYLEKRYYTNYTNDFKNNHTNIRILNTPLITTEIGCTNYSSTCKIICEFLNDIQYNEYDKYLIFYDLNRYDVDDDIKGNVYHIGAGLYEYNYLQKILNNEQIKYINVDNDTSINVDIKEIFDKQYEYIK